MLGDKLNYVYLLHTIPSHCEDITKNCIPKKSMLIS